MCCQRTRHHIDMLPIFHSHITPDCVPHSYSSDDEATHDDGTSPSHVHPPLGGRPIPVAHVPPIASANIHHRTSVLRPSDSIRRNQEACQRIASAVCRRIHIAWTHRRISHLLVDGMEDTPLASGEPTAPRVFTNSYRMDGMEDTPLASGEPTYRRVFTNIGAPFSLKWEVDEREDTPLPGGAQLQLLSDASQFPHNPTINNG